LCRHLPKGASNEACHNYYYYNYMLQQLLLRLTTKPFTLLLAANISME
jgi:hypothetical protein